ncbi:hypothetical protein BT96DRAFT_933084 [Gymnopus androsaceus JB14]|uniref:Uncharacterized protein n=1 Tax=Gymnopus androsaceus JB14 TaxID=1447944 RepID=A0A6A4IG70_9AGAR|nr:hypothetical protein BT96DRAFT_933084 [Gymnopus androsaceus JB14]
MPKAPQKKGPRKTQVPSKPPQAQAGVQEPVFDYPSAPYNMKMDRRAYLGVRNNTDKLGPFMDNIRKLFGQFSRSSPNLFSTQIISSNGETLVAAYQYAAPAHIVEANRQAHDSGKTIDVDEQPTSREFANYKTQPFHKVKIITDLTIIKLRKS